MAYATAAPDMDRLPWLTDTRPAVKRDAGAVLPWVIAATIVVAGASYWLGMNSASDSSGSEPPVATIRLPEPSPLEGQAPATAPLEDVRSVPLPQVQPVRQPAPIAAPKPQREQRATSATSTTTQKSDAEADSAATAESEEAPASAPPSSGPPERWSSWQSAGASGRMVRIGTFSNRQQAKKAWSRLVRVYPGMKSLPAVVVANPSLRNGRAYFRLQFGTTSQAHSEVLCQRMRIIGQSCVTVDLDAASKGGEE